MNKQNEKKMDAAHKRADNRLSLIEIKLDDFYNKHTPAIIKIFNAFYKLNKDEFEEKLQAYKDGEITKDEYRQYMLSKTIFSDDWRTTVDKMTTAIADMNQKALDDIINNNMDDIYIDNYNTTIRAIGDELIEG